MINYKSVIFLTSCKFQEEIDKIIFVIKLKIVIDLHINFFYQLIRKRQDILNKNS